MVHSAAMMGFGAAAAGGPLFAATAYTGNGDATNGIFLNTGQNTASLGGLSWVKQTNAVSNHSLVDTARGGSAQLNTDTTSAEDTSIARRVFEANGVTVKRPNSSLSEYIAFTWLKEAGYFDIVTYTGNGTARTLPHSLAAVPKMIWVKGRSGAIGVEGWWVYHADSNAGGDPEDATLMLNTSDAVSSRANNWGAVPPTTSVFGISNNSGMNTIGTTYIAYLFAEKAGFSKMGSYTGTGAGGNSITGLGFEPNLVLVKRTSSSENWVLFYNDGGAIYGLYPNTTAARFAASITFDSDGFTYTANVAGNSGGDYIYMAWK